MLIITYDLTLHKVSPLTCWKLAYLFSVFVFLLFDVWWMGFVNTLFICYISFLRLHDVTNESESFCFFVCPEMIGLTHWMLDTRGRLCEGQPNLHLFDSTHLTDSTQILNQANFIAWNIFDSTYLIQVTTILIRQWWRHERRQYSWRKEHQICSRNCC